MLRPTTYILALACAVVFAVTSADAAQRRAKPEAPPAPPLFKVDRPTRPMAVERIELTVPTSTVLGEFVVHPLCVSNAYREIARGSLLETEGMPFVLYLSVALGFALVPVLSVTRAVKKDHVRKLQLPSLKRNPFNWRDDPLQFPFVLGMASAGIVIGSTVAAIEYWPQGRWMYGLYCSALAGAACGYLAILKVYRKLFV